MRNSNYYYMGCCLADFRQLSCLGKFQIYWQGREPIKWRTEKVKMLFAYLLQNYHRRVTKEELLDSLWSEDDPKKALQQLYNSIYYIRKTLEQYGANRNHITINGSYQLKLGEVQLDLILYQDLATRLFNNREEITLDQLEQMSQLYQGHYNLYNQEQISILLTSSGSPNQ